MKTPFAAIENIGFHGAKIEHHSGASRIRSNDIAETIHHQENHLAVQFQQSLQSAGAKPYDMASECRVRAKFQWQDGNSKIARRLKSGGISG